MPPPEFATACIAFFIASVSSVFPSPTAPYCSGVITIELDSFIDASTHSVVPSPLDCKICPIVPFNIFPLSSLGRSTFLSTNDLRATPCAADNTLLLSSVVKLSAM